MVKKKKEETEATLEVTEKTSVSLQFTYEYEDCDGDPQTEDRTWLLCPGENNDCEVLDAQDNWPEITKEDFVTLRAPCGETVTLRKSELLALCKALPDLL